MVGLARTMRLRTVAEGIETSGQLECLREIGCVLGQGYYFSRPKPPEELTEVIMRGECRPDPAVQPVPSA
jgi:EAL domain-containing protein (putative c-di-GMP-specific phosphodiesterase class I)